MDAKLHLISGLPRSGSTLLSAILRQNPRFHAGMTGPLGSMVEALLRNMSMRNESSVHLDDAQRERILRGIFTSYYADIPAGDVVFDTNRLWCSRLPLMTTLFPSAKVICCVRDVAEIYDSFERLVRRNKFYNSGLFKPGTGGTVYSRVEQLAGGGAVGFAWNALREAFCGEQSGVILALTYRTLTIDPQKAMDAIYAFIEEPPFHHDFDNVGQDMAPKFDERLGMPTLHTVSPQVKYVKRKSVLPPDIIRRFQGDSFWLDPSRNPNVVRVV